MAYCLIITGGVKTWKKLLIRAWPCRLQPGKRTTDGGQRGMGAETGRQGLAELVGTRQLQVGTLLATFLQLLWQRKAFTKAFEMRKSSCLGIYRELLPDINNSDSFSLTAT